MGGGLGWGGGGVRVDVNQELKFFEKLGGGGRGGSMEGSGLGGQDERRIEVFVKIKKKKNLEGGGGRVGGSDWM